MVNAVYAIDDFPGDALLWRIEWIGGVGYNTSVPSDPQISICLAQLPAGQTDPLSARSRSSQTKRTVRIGVGLLPYISIASVWQQRRPVITDLAASRHRLTIDTSSCRMKRADLQLEWAEVFVAWTTSSRSKPTSRADAFYSVANSRRTLRKRCAPPEWHYRRLYASSISRGACNFNSGGFRKGKVSTIHNTLICVLIVSYNKYNIK